MIQTQSLRYAYRDPETETVTEALKGVDFHAKFGEFIAVLGHNGSGKSTLATHLNAIRLPSGGTVWVDGMDTSKPELLYEIRKTCAMVFQNPDNQIVATVVEEDVAFALENMGVEPAEIRRRVDEALTLVGMQDYCTHAPHLLSGGQKQRVAIAGVLAMYPKCIVLDEPTAMLDPSGRREVLKAVRNLGKSHGITVILITHHMDEAVQADRVVVMQNGNILTQGTPHEIFTQVDLLRQAGLDVPQTVDVLYQMNAQGENLDLSAMDVESCANELAKLLTK